MILHVVAIKFLQAAFFSFFYQSPLILTALLYVDLINVAYLTACAFIRSS